MPSLKLKIKIGDDWSAGAKGFYECRRLGGAGIAHGVSTRSLGNMKNPESRHAALKHLSAAPIFLKQVHGRKVWDAQRQPAGQAAVSEGDGWISGDSDLIPCIYVADCLPLFVWSDDKSFVGVFHAGWRGLAEGMPKAAVEAFKRHGVESKNLSASVGPHIGACCYRVGPEVALRFHEESRIESEDGTRLDLGADAFMQLSAAGVPENKITVSAACTSCLSKEFYSFRREKMDQRMLAFIQKP